MLKNSTEITKREYEFMKDRASFLSRYGRHVANETRPVNQYGFALPSVEEKDGSYLFHWECEDLKGDDVVSIAVKTAPSKVAYTEGENFDPTGLVITATYDDESTADILYEEEASKFSFSPALNVALTTENTSVTITYAEKTATQAITVAAKTLNSIIVKTAPAKVEYAVGDKFDPTGLVITKIFVDESTEDLPYAGNEADFTFVPALDTALTVADEVIIVKYAEKAAEIDITVSAE